MVWNWFKRKSSGNSRDHLLEINDKFGALNESLNDSFKRIQEDMDVLSKQTKHSHSRHNQHDAALQNVVLRLSAIEDFIESLAEQKVGNYGEEMEVPEPEYPETSELDALTETQQKILWKLMALQNENPGEWFSLKYLAQEVYPDRSYNSVRSALSQFISNLEEMGYVKRKRRGKQAYVFLARRPTIKKKSKASIKVRN